MRDELDRIWLAELLVESWTHSQAHDYTEDMVTPEVEAVRDIGDAINEDRIMVAPKAFAVTGHPMRPFVFTHQIMELQDRLETALSDLRQRRQRLLGN